MNRSIVIILLIFVGILAIGVFFLKPRTTAPAVLGDSSVNSKREVDLSDIANDPVVFTDLVVEVDGRIVDWVTKESFSLGSNQQGFFISQDVLVITRNQFKLPDDTPADELALGEEANVKVRGEVRLFKRKELEDEWGIDLYDQEVDAWMNRPVILAESIEKI